MITERHPELLEVVSIPDRFYFKDGFKLNDSFKILRKLAHRAYHIHLIEPEEIYERYKSLSR